MKNKKLKLIALAGVTLTTAVMLTGCGNNYVKTYDKDQMNVNIEEMTEANNIQELNNTIEENKSIFKDKTSLNYTSNPKDDENGKIAIQKLGEDIFKTEVKDGYYVYVDNFNNSYNIKEIKSIKSKYYMTGNNNWANLFKCTVNYIDNKGANKSFDTAVIIPENNNGEYIMTPFENYTGSTSFVRGFTNLSEEDTNEPSTSVTLTENEIKELYLDELKKDNNNNPEKLLDYRVDKVSIMSEDDKKSFLEFNEGLYYKDTDVFAYVEYSVKPQDINNSAWIAGNGKIEGDWIVEKVACVTIRNGEIIGDGTGW